LQKGPLRLISLKAASEFNLDDTPRNSGLFITGTDTGVGKTLVAAGLVRLARKRDLHALAVKPVETGCPFRDGMLYPEDGTLLQEASEGDLTLDECAPFRFSLPASPARAAATEGQYLNLHDIVEHVLALGDRADFLVVEGAGGLMVPIRERLMMIDLIGRIGYPVLLVARRRLGTINHTLLSVEALQRRDIEIRGIVVSQTDADAGPEEDYTAGDLSRLLKDIPVATLPRIAPESLRNPADIAQTMAATWPEDLIHRWIGSA